MKHKNSFFCIAAFICILLIFTARHHPPSRRKIKEIWHGRVYWEEGANTTMLRSVHKQKDTDVNSETILRSEDKQKDTDVNSETMEDYSATMVSEINDLSIDELSGHEQVVKKVNRDFLLFTSAGDKSNVKQWIENDRNYDIVVVYYGNTQFDYDVDEIYIRKETKFPNFQWYMKTHSIDKYKAIAVWDDDIQASPGAINQLFTEMLKSQADVFSPCHTRGNFPSLYKHNPDGWRYVEYVEMNAPMFLPWKIKDFMSVFDPLIKGWGTELWYGHRCNKIHNHCVMAVSDSFCVFNPKTRKDGTREINKAQSEHIRSKTWNKYAIDVLKQPSGNPRSSKIKGYDHLSQISDRLKKRDRLKKQKTNKITILIIVDVKSQNKYKKNIENMRCYANKHQYTFLIEPISDKCEKINSGNFFFQKHCTVKQLMESIKSEWIMVLDADNAVVNFDKKIEEFIDESKQVIHGTRFHNNEISAGNYIIRNTDWGRKYLTDWYSSLKNGFGGMNHDNGALHWLLLKKLADESIPGWSECVNIGKQNKNYYAFLNCVQVILAATKCQNFEWKHIKIIPNTISSDWLAIDVGRTHAKWSSRTFMFHGMKEPYLSNHGASISDKCSSDLQNQVTTTKYKEILTETFKHYRNDKRGWDSNSCVQAPKVTVTLGIPCIKKDIDKIQRLKNSIYAQTVQPDEVILVISNIPQDECPVIGDWKVFCHKQLQHAGISRNEVWLKASSEVVTFIDADDELYPERIEMVRDYFSHNAKLMLLLHEHSREPLLEHQQVKYPVAAIDGHGLYLQMKQTQGKQLHLHGHLHHGHVSIRKKIECDRYTNRRKGQDSEFVRKCVQKLGDSADKMIWLKVPLTRYLPRSVQIKHPELITPETIPAIITRNVELVGKYKDKHVSFYMYPVPEFISCIRQSKEYNFYKFYKHGGELWWFEQLQKSPFRTNTPQNAELFVMPLFTGLTNYKKICKQELKSALASIKAEKTWNDGYAHLLLSTHFNPLKIDCGKCIRLTQNSEWGGVSAPMVSQLNSWEQSIKSKKQSPIDFSERKNVFYFAGQADNRNAYASRRQARHVFKKLNYPFITCPAKKAICAKNFKENMFNTKFGLHIRGDLPSSSRLYEWITVQAIPLMMSDHIYDSWLPGKNIPWKEFSIPIKENQPDVKLQEQLERISNMDIKDVRLKLDTLSSYRPMLMWQHPKSTVSEMLLLDAKEYKDSQKYNSGTKQLTIKAKTTKSECALLFFGLAKHFNDMVYPSIQKYILNTNPNCDVYAHTYDIKEITNPRNKEDRTPVNPLEVYSMTHNVVIDTLESVSKEIDFDYYHKHYKQSGGVFPYSMDNSLKQWFSIQRVWESMPSKYKRIGLFRLDVLYTEPIDIQNGDAVIPDFHHWGGLNDRCFYGLYKWAEIWATNRLKKLSIRSQQKNKYDMNAEHFMKYLMRDVPVELKPMCFNRVRATGKIKHDCKPTPSSSETLTKTYNCLPIDTTGNHKKMVIPSDKRQCLIESPMSERVSKLCDSVLGEPMATASHKLMFGDIHLHKNEYTMVGVQRLKNFAASIAEVNRLEIPGDIVELGVWRGGGMMVASAINIEAIEQRELYLFDAFENIPGYGSDSFVKYLQVEESFVKDGFFKFGVMNEHVHFRKGLFQDTVPSWNKNDKIAVLRVDGNFYDSYQDAMYYMYESVPVGGIIIFDDVMSHASVMRFWKDFKKEQGLEEDLNRIDKHSAWFRKEKDVILNWKYFRAPQDVNKKTHCPMYIRQCHPSWPKRLTKTYHSSKWEQLWLDNIKQWQDHQICEVLSKQKEQIHAFMKDTCSASTDTDWCLIDDSVHQVWYNTKNGQVVTKKPSSVTTISTLQKMNPKDDTIWSYFELPDGTREYIEPLVSHLRHPLTRCLFGETFLVDRSYVLPGNPKDKKTFLFDAGASHWSQGAGGPSLSYFTTVWKRYGFDWSHIEGWEGGTTIAKFQATVPPEWRSRTHFHQEWISTSPTKQPFVPDVIRSLTSKEDYVVFKLDIDSKSVETAIVEYLLEHHEDLKYIDEFVWEHHVDNYIMAPNWKKTQDMTKSIADSYQYFLKLRKLGVRAHSWV